MRAAWAVRTTRHHVHSGSAGRLQTSLARSSLDGTSVILPELIQRCAWLWLALSAPAADQRAYLVQSRHGRFVCLHFKSDREVQPNPQAAQRHVYSELFATPDQGRAFGKYVAMISQTTRWLLF